MVCKGEGSLSVFVLGLASSMKLQIPRINCPESRTFGISLEIETEGHAFLSSSPQPPKP